MSNIAFMIDHTLLKADATKAEIEELCSEALEYEFASVCVNPCNIQYCKEILKDSKVKITTVVGFPLGATTMDSKAYETMDAINKGAEEIDMVINIGALKDGAYHEVLEDIKSVINASQGRALIKVIIETALLNEEEKTKACEIVMEAGADYVKTSTGFSSAGANLEDIRLIKSIVGSRIKIKASGGIKDYKTAIQMIEAGANRLGTSSGVSIMKEKFKY